MKRLFLLLIAIGLSGCASTTHQVGRDLTVMNDPNQFSLHIGTVENFSHRLQYRWVNQGTKATVRQAASITGGSATVEVRDATGQRLHSKSLSESGSFVTAAGKPGTWRVDLILAHATGSVTFEVRRAD